MIPFGRTVTLGDALEAIDLKRASPAPDPDMDADPDDDDELEAAPPAAHSSAHPPDAPPATLSPSRDDDPDSFAKLAGKVGTQLGISLLGGIHRRRGVEPNQLDDDDVDHLEQETAKAIRRGIGDGPVPWWAPVVSAWGLAYFAMGNGARRLERPAPDQLVVEPPEPASSPAPTSTFTVPPPPTGPIRPPATKPAPIQITPTRAA